MYKCNVGGITDSDNTNNGDLNKFELKHVQSGMTKGNALVLIKVINGKAFVGYASTRFSNLDPSSKSEIRCDATATDGCEYPSRSRFSIYCK